MLVVSLAKNTQLEIEAVVMAVDVAVASVSSSGVFGSLRGGGVGGVGVGGDVGVGVEVVASVSAVVSVSSSGVFGCMRGVGVCGVGVGSDVGVGVEIDAWREVLAGAFLVTRGLGRRFA